MHILESLYIEILCDGANKTLRWDRAIKVVQDERVYVEPFPFLAIGLASKLLIEQRSEALFPCALCAVSQFKPGPAQHSTAQHSTTTTQHSTAQHSTAQHRQHSTAQHSTAQQGNVPS
jgi:hypothetical protein